MRNAGHRQLLLCVTLLMSIRGAYLCHGRWMVPSHGQCSDKTVGRRVSCAERVDSLAITSGSPRTHVCAVYMG